MSMPWTSVKSLVVMTTSGSSAPPERSRAAALSLCMHHVSASLSVLNSSMAARCFRVALTSLQRYT